MASESSGEPRPEQPAGPPGHLGSICFQMQKQRNLRIAFPELCWGQYQVFLSAGSGH